MSLETQAIYNFVQKTRSGEMRWKKEVSKTEFANFHVPERYTTHLHDEALELSVESYVDTESDVDYHRTSARLWLLDEQDERLWPFPDNEALGDLLDTVRFQTGKVADRLKRLMEGSQN